jgi:restriction system protein
MTDISEQGFTYVMPDLLVDKVNFSKVYVNYGVMEKETSFGIDMSISEMGLSKTLRSRDLDLLPGKVEATLHSWEKKYGRFLEAKERERKEANIGEMNAEAESAIKRLGGILAHTLDVHDAIDWDLIKITDEARVNTDNLFEGGLVPDFMNFDATGRPVSFIEIALPEKPTIASVKNQFGIFTQKFRGTKIKRKHEEETGHWTKEELETRRKNEEREKQFQQALEKFETKAAAFNDEKRRNNEALEHIRGRYKSAEPKAVEEYCDLVLDSSDYPDYFPKNWLLEYRADDRTIVTNYEIPSPDQLPSVESYKYDKDKDSVIESRLSQEAQETLYDSLAYQICIRTLHELFEADVVNAIDVVTFNGVVTIINPATGKTELRCILSASSGKNEFLEFDLARVDPQATFAHLGGQTAGPPHELKSVKQVQDMAKTDKRYI